MILLIVPSPKSSINVAIKGRKSAVKGYFDEGAPLSQKDPANAARQLTTNVSARLTQIDSSQGLPCYNIIPGRCFKGGTLFNCVFHILNITIQCAFVLPGSSAGE